jgi:hypothetical protein
MKPVAPVSANSMQRLRGAAHNPRRRQRECLSLVVRSTSGKAISSVIGTTIIRPPLSQCGQVPWLRATSAQFGSISIVETSGTPQMHPDCRLDRFRAVTAQNSCPKLGGRRTQLGHRVSVAIDPSRKWRVHRSSRDNKWRFLLAGEEQSQAMRRITPGHPLCLFSPANSLSPWSSSRSWATISPREGA